MKFLCPTCHEVLQVQFGDLGTRGKCACCGSLLNIPDGRFAPGMVVGGFMIQRLIGQGGMGDVYLAHELALDRTVALKVVAIDRGADEDEVERLLHEARASARFSHPHVVQCFSVGQDEDIFYMAMEYVEGQSLGARVRERGPVPVTEVARFVGQVCRALDAAWATHQMVHCDIKPDNILVTEDGTAKLTDFGLAQVYSGTTGYQTRDDFFGSPYYVAPEVILGRSVDSRCDLYSLGATVYHLLTGSPPYGGETAVEVASKHVTDPVPKASEAVADLPPSIDAVIAKAMAKDRDNRYASAAEMATAFQEAAGLPSEAMAPEDDSEGVEDSQVEGMWRCAECQALNHNWSTQCFRCGASGYEVCPVCERQVRIGLEHCPGCGADVAEAKFALFREQKGALQRLSNAVLVKDYEGAVEISREISQYDGRPTPPEFQKRCAEVMTRLRADLEELLADARAQRNLGHMTRVLGWLESFFGDEHYRRLREEVETATTAIRNEVLRARVAMKAHCYHHALTILTDKSLWRGGERGSELQSLIMECEDQVSRRETVVAAVDASMEGGRLEEALEDSRALEEFRLPGRLIYRKLSRTDLDYNGRLLDTMDRLAKAVVARFKRWASRDRWKPALHLWQSCSTHEGLLRAGCRERMDAFVAELVAERSRRARDLESNRNFSESARAWRAVLRVPSVFLPIADEQVARGYSFRRLRYLRNGRERILRRYTLAMVFAWCVPFGFLSANVIRNVIDQRLLVPALFGLLGSLLLQFVAFGLALRRLRRTEVMVNEDLIPGRQPSPFALGLSFATALSPVSYLVFKAVQLAAQRTAVQAHLGVLVLDLMVVLLLWLLVDVFRMGKFRSLPNAFGLSLAWMFTACAVTVAHLYGAPTEHVLPWASMLHGLVFAAIEWLHYRLHRPTQHVEDATRTTTITSHHPVAM